jgi:hypothetical protein
MRILRLAVAMAGLALAEPAVAQPSPTADTQAAYDAAFQETLKKPSDPKTLVKFADLAVQVGNLEGAISALERLLLINGNQPGVKVELGVLYYRLGSYEAARTYLESARQSAGATPEIKDKAGQYISDIDSQVGRSQFSGSILNGIQYSSNANSGTAGALQSVGPNVVTTPNVSSQPDFNYLLAATIDHRYDLNRQDNGALESELQFYMTQQFQVTSANVLFVDFTTGPRTSPFESGLFSNLTMRPFVTGRYVAVGNMPSYWAWGGGMEGGTPITSQMQATLSVFGRRREFLNNPTVPTNNEGSGNEGVVSSSLQVALTSYMTLTLSGLYTRFIASVPAQSYGEVALGGTMEVRFDDPLGINGRSWALTASGGIAQATYDQPDPTVNSTIARSQNDVNLGLVLAIPMTETLALIGQVNYFERSASLSTYSYNALTALVGVGWRF